MDLSHAFRVNWKPVVISLSTNGEAGKSNLVRLASTKIQRLNIENADTSKISV